MDNSSEFTRDNILKLIFRVTCATAVAYFTLKSRIFHLDPKSESAKDAKIKAENQLKRLSKGAVNFTAKPQQFNEYELMIASNLVVPDDIDVSWSDIAGLDELIEELKDTVVLPITHKNLMQQSKLWCAPKGVLLYGPPGCGKTLIAKATAKESGMRFINLDVAMLADKWYGESQKLANAVFSLAAKIQPCIIFIDEVDSFLRKRNQRDHETTAMMKTQFLKLWDGLSSNADLAVIVMGATNRPEDLDKAVLRRMPAQFYIGLPSEEQRLEILKMVMKSEKIHKSVNFKQLAELTNNFYGSDLRELCRDASIFRMRRFLSSPEYAATQNESITETDSAYCITMEDLLNSLQKIQNSKMHIAANSLDDRNAID